MFQVKWFLVIPGYWMLRILMRMLGKQLLSACEVAMEYLLALTHSPQASFCVVILLDGIRILFSFAVLLNLFQQQWIVWSNSYHRANFWCASFRFTGSTSTPRMQSFWTRSMRSLSVSGHLLLNARLRPLTGSERFSLTGDVPPNKNESIPVRIHDRASLFLVILVFIFLKTVSFERYDHT